MTGGWAAGAGRLVATVLQVPDLLPTGFGLPSPIYWVPTGLAMVAALFVLYSIDPTITDWTAVALTPWIGVGAVFHVLYQQPAFFAAARPLFGTPMVYLTTTTTVAVVWTLSELAADLRSVEASTDRQLGAVGAGAFLALVGWSSFITLQIGPGVTLRPFWPTLGLFVAILVAGVAWVLLTVRFSRSAALAGKTGLMVLFGHTLDAISTALAVDGPITGFTERTPLSRWFLDVGAALPTADLVGSAWLFVLVKILLASVVVVAFRDMLEERPTAARTVLILVAAVGFGPGVHNVVLFTVRESVGLA